ncbi:MAG: cytochrome P450 [Myxococcota bacterium]
MSADDRIARDAVEPIEAMMAQGPNAPIEDPYTLYARARREAPVARLAGVERPTFLFTRHADVRAALRDPARFSSASNGDRGIALVIGRTVVGMDGEEHLRHRALITPAVAPRALRGAFAERVERIADALIDPLAQAGRADLVRDFAFLYPIRVFVEPLGLPPEDVERFHHWSIDLTGIAKDPARGFAAATAIRAYLEPIITERRKALGDDILSTLIRSEVPVPGKDETARLGDDQIANFLMLLIMAGAETTYHLLGSTLFALLSHPAALDAVRAAPDRIPLAIDETLRWESPVQIVTRELTADVEIAGVRIAKGSDAILGIGPANRDPEVFADPDRFDLERFAPDAKSADGAGVEHIAFGFGRHYCAGSRLALLEAETGLRRLLARLPNLRFDTEARPARMGGFAFRSPDHLPVRFD